MQLRAKTTASRTQAGTARLRPAEYRARLVAYIRTIETRRVRCKKREGGPDRAHAYYQTDEDTLLSARSSVSRGADINSRRISSRDDRTILSGIEYSDGLLPAQVSHYDDEDTHTHTTHGSKSYSTRSTHTLTIDG